MSSCCIIGAGLFGLYLAKQLRDLYEVSVFEAKEDIGGQWLYSPLSDEDTPDTDLFKQIYGHQQSSIYDATVTVTPARATQFEDFPIQYPTQFVSRHTILQYLRDYTDHFNIRPLISFNTAVVLVKPLSQEEFEVTTRNTSGEETTRIFNRVIVAIGHFSIPYIPKIPGIETFPGAAWHVHNRKVLDPSVYSNMTILVIGFYLSGSDKLTFFINEGDNCKVVASCDRVAERYISAIRDPVFHEKIASGRLIIKPLVTQISGKTVTFSDGSTQEVDEIVYSTGFGHSFPFLPHRRISENGKYVYDLWRGIFDVNYPRLVHAGLHRKFSFPQAYFLCLLLKQEWSRPQNPEKLKAELAAFEEALTAAGRPLHYTYYTIFDNAETTRQAFKLIEGPYECEEIANLTDFCAKFMLSQYWQFFSDRTGLGN